MNPSALRLQKLDGLIRVRADCAISNLVDRAAHTITGRMDKDDF
jgi:hypothetical protein